MKSALDKLKSTKVKMVKTIEEVKSSFFKDSLGFPLVIKPVIEGYNLNNWIEDNKDEYEKKLQKYGAILCRGFGINTVERFQSLMDNFSEDLLEYKLRSSPRFALTDNVYVSTTYPEDQSINMHSESSYAPDHPAKITFCCIVEPTFRGETPIADNRMVLSFLSKQLRQKFSEKGILYRRNLNGLLGLSWEEVFQSNDRKYVEEECVKNGMNFEWVNKNELVLTWAKKAIWKHPITNEQVWFNHGLFFNKYMQHQDILKSVSSDEELPNNTFFGDGTKISENEIEELKLAYKKSTIEFKWKKGDVLFLDNMLFSHSRNPYKGERQIIVSIS